MDKSRDSDEASSSKQVTWDEVDRELRSLRVEVLAIGRVIRARRRNAKTGSKVKTKKEVA